MSNPLSRLMTPRWARFALALLLPLAVVGAYLGYLQLSGNFHVVREGQLYRSAQPTAAQLRAYVRNYGIRTVINLRGRNDKAGWYQAEMAESRALGVRHIDFRMSASRELTRDEASQLLSILRDAPRPILIHCRGGSDRSGLVAAIFLHDVAGEDIGVAKWQLSLIYGHIGIPYLSSAFAMDESWDMLERAYRGRAQPAKS